jgi:ribonucleoside-diphosphate reductase beta chain
MESILTPDPNRYVLFPIPKERLPIWEAYKNHMVSFWTAEELDFNADKDDWDRLSDGEKHFIEYILAFFAASDGIVLENIIENFSTEVQWAEARCFYGFQAMMENIHSEVYSLLIDTYVTDSIRKHNLFNAITTIPSVSKKANWAKHWMDNSQPFNIRLVAFAVVEGLFFSASFCAIFWLKSRNIMTRALGKSNEMIARDEALHTDFAVLLTSYLTVKASEETAHNIFREAVFIEQEFICDALPYNLKGMNKNLMCRYIEYVADYLLLQLGYNKIYNSKNPFEFMSRTSLDGKTNFFEARVTEYSRPESVSNNTYEVVEDF